MQPHFVKTRQKSPAGATQSLLPSNDPLKQIMGRNPGQNRQPQNTYIDTQPSQQPQNFGGLFGGNTITGQMKVNTLTTPHNAIKNAQRKSTNNSKQVFGQRTQSLNQEAGGKQGMTEGIRAQIATPRAGMLSLDEQQQQIAQHQRYTNIVS